jgi:prophage regulatory protein
MSATKAKLPESTAQAPTVPQPVDVRLLSKAEVLERVGVTFPTVWKWQQEGKFPRSRELGGKVAWLEHEITEWILARPISRLKCDDLP